MIDPNCIFCKIVAGELPCAKVYESERVLGFLDIAPVRPGHCLLIPKAHYPDLYALPAEYGQALLEAAGVVGRAMERALGSTGCNMGMNVGASAGQMVFHAHFHLIPRIEGDGLSLWPQHGYDSPDQMRTLAMAIAAHIR